MELTPREGSYTFPMVDSFLSSVTIDKGSVRLLMDVCADQ